MAENSPGSVSKTLNSHIDLEENLNEHSFALTLIMPQGYGPTQRSLLNPDLAKILFSHLPSNGSISIPWKATMTQNQPCVRDNAVLSTEIWGVLGRLGRGCGPGLAAERVGP